MSEGEGEEGTGAENQPEETIFCYCLIVRTLCNLISTIHLLFIGFNAMVHH